MTLDQKVKRIAKAVKGLASTADRPIARRNARARVLSALRAVRNHIDAEFPALVAREGVKRLTPQGRIARLKRQGWVQLDDVLGGSRIAGQFALYGVPIKTVKVSNPQQDGTTIVQTFWFIPAWADVIGVHPTQLRAAVRSRTVRNAALAADALVNG